MIILSTVRTTCSRKIFCSQEHGQREVEERARLQHLNRAKDIDMLRTQPFDILNNSSKLAGLGEAVANNVVKPSKVGKRKFPDSYRCFSANALSIATKGHISNAAHEHDIIVNITLFPLSTRTFFSSSSILRFYDYNILSNIPLSQHHFDHPDARPIPAQKHPKERLIPAFLTKDFDIITNRYKQEHADKKTRDFELNLLEATAKHRTRNRFNPLTQAYLDPAEDNRMKVFAETHEVEIVNRAMALVPPSTKNRPSAFYNILNPDEVTNEDQLKWMGRTRLVVCPLLCELWLVSL